MVGSDDPFASYWGAFVRPIFRGELGGVSFKEGMPCMLGILDAAPRKLKEETFGAKGTKSLGARPLRFGGFMFLKCNSLRVKPLAGEVFHSFP